MRIAQFLILPFPKKNNEWDILPFQGKAPTKKDLAVFMERIRGI